MEYTGADSKTKINPNALQYAGDSKNESHRSQDGHCLDPRETSLAAPASANSVYDPAGMQGKEPTGAVNQAALVSALEHWSDGVGARGPALAAPDSGLLVEAGYQGSDIELPHRAQLEKELGIDLKGIRAQVGNPEGMSRLGADAFATGNLVAFQNTQPPYEQAREEVIHTLQQGRGQGRGVSDPSSAAERDAHAGRNVGTGHDAALHRQQSLTPPNMAKGTQFTLTEANVLSMPLGLGRRILWETIARDNGLTEEELKKFNPEAEAKVGSSIKIPSAEEQTWQECLRKSAQDIPKALQLYQELQRSGGIKVLAAARHRASGTLGLSYGNDGIQGKAGPNRFLTPNPDLAGTSQKNSRTVDGRVEYETMWDTSFWKCNVFMEDSIYQAGYKPAMHGETGKKHYSSAGNVDEYKDLFKKITVDQAGPGTVVQFDGGSGSDESHNAILSSFVTRNPVSWWRSFGSKKEEDWSMTIIGAESDRAAASTRAYTVEIDKNDEYKIQSTGKTIRFFRPLQER